MSDSTKTSSRRKSVTVDKEVKSPPVTEVLMSAKQYADTKGLSKRLNLWLKKTYKNDLRTSSEWDKEFKIKQLV